MVMALDFDTDVRTSIVQHWTDRFPFEMVAITVSRLHIIVASSWQSDCDQQLIEASPKLLLMMSPKRHKRHDNVAL